MWKFELMMDVTILTTIIYTWKIEFPYDRGRRRKKSFLNRFLNSFATKAAAGMSWFRRRFDTRRQRSRPTTKTKSRYCRRFYRSTRSASSGIERTRQAQFCIKKALPLGIILTSLAGTTATTNSPKFDTVSSPSPGLIAQLRGIPTSERYTCATVFVDHFSRFSYVHLQKTTAADATVEAKESFERLAESHGVRVQHYHADNGIFADTKFLAHVAKSNQSISFCGAYAHFQNGVAEKRIRDLQELHWGRNCTILEANLHLQAKLLGLRLRMRKFIAYV